MKRLVIFALALSFPGCVTLPRHNADMEMQQMKADMKYQAVVGQANIVIAELRERLTRLGQIGKDGNLIPLVPAAKK